MWDFACFLSKSAVILKKKCKISHFWKNWKNFSVFSKMWDFTLLWDFTLFLKKKFKIGHFSSKKWKKRSKKNQNLNANVGVQILIFFDRFFHFFDEKWSPKTEKNDQKLTFLMFLFKNVSFWCFYSKMSVFDVFIKISKNDIFA